MNLEAPLRTALMSSSDITDLLGTWQLEPAILTRRPIPKEAETKPCIVISPDINNGDMDGLTARRPIITKDITVYGEQTKHYFIVQDIGWLIRDLFHRVKNTFLSIEEYNVVSVVATGPFVGPTEDDSTVARIVTLTITLDRR